VSIDGIDDDRLRVRDELNPPVQQEAEFVAEEDVVGPHRRDGERFAVEVQGEDDVIAGDGLRHQFDDGYGRDQQPGRFTGGLLLQRPRVAEVAVVQPHSRPRGELVLPEGVLAEVGRVGKVKWVRLAGRASEGHSASGIVPTAKERLGLQPEGLSPKAQASGLGIG